MAYAANSLARWTVGVGNAAGAANVSRLWGYRTTDTLATILAAGYFNAAYGRLNEGDRIMVAASIGGTLETADLYVSSSNATAVVIGTKSRDTIRGTSAPTSDATAGARTYTAAEILGGTIVRDTAGASRTDTLPTAALLVAAIPDARVGQCIDCLIVNGADAAETITLQAGSGGGFDANQTASSRIIGQNASKLIRIRLTNVTAASEAYTVAG